METIINKKIKNYIPPAHWDFLTPLYDRGCVLLGFGRRFRLGIIQSLNLTGAERILDAGCGTGTSLLMVKKLYPEVAAEGLDPDEKALAIAREKSLKNNVSVILHGGIMDDMPFENNTFDVVVSSLVFHHLEKGAKIASLRECLRVLKPKGRMLLVDFGPPGHSPVSRILSKIFSLFESIEDGREGKIPLLMLDVGFSGVNEVGRYLHGISFYEGYK
ncbi:MAG: class I SAM-dependent methyltransferase [Nitrospinae bacterium]|nr:class I SAM-dependent methyltransferase [Nitrospinota bacterium]MBI3812986.1 class I SAM-dependent methyltransferase [Nitrospinota bacterium]